MAFIKNTWYAAAVRRYERGRWLFNRRQDVLSNSN